MNGNGFFASVDNPTPEKNLYPTAGGPTLGGASGGASATSLSSAADDSGGSAGGMAMAMGAAGKPIAWWVTLIVLFFVLGFVAKKTGNEGDFSNLKLSGYNILMIGLASIIFIGAAKVIFTRFTVPGLTTFIGAI